MKKAVLLTGFFFFVLSLSLFSEEFRFLYRSGEKYRIVSTVEEDVYVNDIYSHTAEILNRIAIEVSDTEQNSGFLQAEFVTSEKSAGQGTVYEWGEDYYSEFWRGEDGSYDIEAKYYMPVVRNVPLFPDRSIEIGESWTAEGWEVHDFRQNFNLPEPFSFPIRVHYTYLGRVTRDGTEYDRISIEYSVFYRVRELYSAPLYPVRISGFSRQDLLWDSKAGRPFSYSEEFDFMFTLSSGDTVEYVGTAKAEVVHAEYMNREETVENIKEILEEKGYEDTEVRADEKGVTISIENIQFLPESAVLLSSEKKKLRVIADILKEYPGRDILVTGHTALWGTKESQQTLSEERAAAVAGFLLDVGTRQSFEMITRGMGAREPIADNSSEAGMSRNRRVEITILEN